MRTIRLNRSAPGQSLVLIALMLPFLVALVLSAIEIGGRMLQRAEVEDALRNATRSAVQTFAYAQFAKNTQELDASAACSGTLSGGCAGNAVAQLAADLLIINLQSTDGLAATPEQIAAEVRWQIAPAGGSCSDLSARAGLATTFANPAVCAVLDVPMQGLVGWGSWTPRVEAADTLDRFE